MLTALDNAAELFGQHVLGHFGALTILVTGWVVALMVSRALRAGKSSHEPRHSTVTPALRTDGVNQTKAER